MLPMLQQMGWCINEVVKSLSSDLLQQRALPSIDIWVIRWCTADTVGDRRGQIRRHCRGSTRVLSLTRDIVGL